MKVPPTLDLSLVSGRLGSRVQLATPLCVESSSGSRTRWRHLVTDGAQRWIVRQPRSAAALDRLIAENALLIQLAESPIPVPVPLVSVDPADATAFDVVTYVEGHRVLDHLPLALPRTAATRHDLSAALVDVLVRLHAMDPLEVGLDPATAPPLEVLVAGWDRRWRAAGIESAEVDELLRRLYASLPPACPAGIVHGAFHLRNLVFALDDPSRVAAVLGWEFATVGDPLCDLGLLLALWVEDDAEPVTAWLPWTALTRDDGFFSRSTVTHEYMVCSQRNLRQVEWYVGLGYLSLAVFAAEEATPSSVGAIKGMAAQALARAGHSGIQGLTG